MTVGAILTLLPFFVLFGGAFVVYGVCRVGKLGNKTEAILTSIVLLSAIAALFLQGSILLGRPSVKQWHTESLVFEEFQLAASLIGVFFIAVTCMVGIFICLYSGEYLSRDPRYLLYYPLVLILIAGLLGMFYVKDLFSLFILAELNTITASGLTAFRFNQAAAVKAGFKYLVMSSLGTLVMLLGIYIIFRETGLLNLSELAVDKSMLVSFGGGCFVLGFSIKAGIVPLHAWVPEVYANAPSAVSGLFAGVISKSMLFILPGICLKLNISSAELGTYLLVFSGANMLVGAIQMLTQQNLRRFLAFSTITHTGYLMFILAIYLLFNMQEALVAALFSFVSIALLKTMGFLCVGMYEYCFAVKTFHDIKGGSQRMSFNAVCFSIALAGLAGFPLLVGFIGKWLIYSASIRSKDPYILIGLAVFLISSNIALISYLSVLVKQYQPYGKKSKPLPKKKAPLWMKIPVGVLAVSAIFLGLMPSFLLDSLVLIAERIMF
jgi:multicomponent Na+:H+ antiporter subunit D